MSSCLGLQKSTGVGVGGQVVNDHSQVMNSAVAQLRRCHGEILCAEVKEVCLEISLSQMFRDERSSGGYKKASACMKWPMQSLERHVRQCVWRKASSTGCG